VIVPSNGHLRSKRDTGPAEAEDEIERVSLDGTQLARVIRDAVHLEMRSTVKVKLEERDAMKDKAILIMAVALLAAVIGFSVAAAFMAWGPR
jgi:hypothetical protein